MALAMWRISWRRWLSQLPPQTIKAWRWDLATGLLAGVYQGCVWTFVPRVARADLGATAREMGWIAAAPALGYVLATVWARQMEGRAKLPFVYWTWLVARGLFMLTPLIATRRAFVALVCITPFIFSVSTPAYTSIMKEIYPDAVRGRLMSAVRIGMTTAMLLTAMVAGRLLDAGIPWQMVFGFGGIMGAASAWAFSRVPVADDSTAGDSVPSTPAFLRDTLMILVRNPGYRWYTASVFVYGTGNIIASTIYPIYLVDQFHITNTQVATMANVAAVATIAGFFFWGSFMDRRGPLVTVLVALAIICVQPVLFAVAHSLTLLYVASAAAGMAVSGIDIGYLNTTLMFSEPGRAAQYQALHSSFFGIRGSIAPHLAIPLMLAIGARGVFWVGLAIMLAGTWLQWNSMRDYRREVRPV